MTCDTLQSFEAAFSAESVRSIMRLFPGPHPTHHQHHSNLQITLLRHRPRRHRRCSYSPRHTRGMPARLRNNRQARDGGGGAQSRRRFCNCRCAWLLETKPQTRSSFCDSGFDKAVADHHAVTTHRLRQQLQELQSQVHMTTTEVMQKQQVGT